MDGVALPQQLVHLRVAPFSAFLGIAPAGSTVEELGTLALPLKRYLGLVELTRIVVENFPVSLQQGRARGTRPMREQSTHGIVAFRKLCLEGGGKRWTMGHGTNAGAKEAPSKIANAWTLCVRLKVS